jgi:membrane protein implicated in regulation of membrane protease activity
MLGATGRALTSIEPGGRGRIETRGEIWTAAASEPINAGDVVRVVGVQNLLLTVRPERSPKVRGEREISSPC